MSERPILFNAPMVRAILDGSKTQTRRVIKPEPVLRDGLLWWDWSKYAGSACHTRPGEPSDTWLERCPHGAPGDRLWVREAWAANEGTAGGFVYRADHFGACGVYAADLKSGAWTTAVSRWRPSIHMPRAASRITLEVVAVRVEQLQAISEADARAEGMPASVANSPRVWYSMLWTSINGPGSWDANPWVWVVEFRKLP